MKDEEFYKNLGVVLRAEREKRNLSQQEIADKPRDVCTQLH